ncbi:hypothetical protein LTR78_008921 [Recurvomyces mirabilis]|uniref:Xaa-Pro dipeptidyl-peptidase C-terminal domain-containing protein n=1 Tax=Recurvomyces mirabilis TaxID=574656 RepID=A0AAE0TQ38_9PEZI|nr:hypothetical protein LTR78_008921 [Recurvomyces mirabilis]KAK5159722.1 hypothetical protein LTS14_001827 [Recurvomyces mirabilis]
MTDKYPHMNEYWRDKTPNLPNTDVPMYVTMSYSTGLHTEGSYRGWKYSSSKDKWLRIHSTQEWHDLYQPENTDDLQRFLDHYLLGKGNGWETTPKVRVSLLRYGDSPDISHRPEDDYPPSRTQYHTLFLDSANAKLSHKKPGSSSTTSYKSGPWEEKGVHFTYAFDKYTEILGPPKIKLFMSTPDQNDMDVFIKLRKVDVDGNVLTSLNVPMKLQPHGTKLEQIDNLVLYRHEGPMGRLRASKRALGQDPMLSEAQVKSQAPTELWLVCDKEEKVPPGTVVELDIPIWPTSMVFNAGESLRLEVCGHINNLHEFPDSGRLHKNLNNGVHSVHSGAEFPSQIMLPLLF